jgi:phosphate uptake regulator
MFHNLLQGSKPTLIHDAVEEILHMLEQGHVMFQASCAALTEGCPPEGGLPQDEDLNVGERLVRRMVFQHLIVNPQQDLSTSVALLSVVHDVERIGDYAKSLVELSRWSTQGSTTPMAQSCQKLHEMVEPEFVATLKALRDSDEAAARQVMRDHAEVKALTDDILEQAMESDDGSREVLVYAVASRYLRRVSGHLSNVATAVINPIDQLSGKENPA